MKAQKHTPYHKLNFSIATATIKLQIGQCNLNMKLAKFFVILALIAAISSGSGSSSVHAKSKRRNVQEKRVEILDSRYTVEWQADFDENTIEFLVIVETTGFVGFGLSVSGTMTGSDIVIGGVFPNGTAYFADYHGTGFVSPVLDEVQNWDFIEGSEQNGVTRLKFKRALDTCDFLDDEPITGGTIKIIWAIGSTDNIVQHTGTNRGALAVNMLDPPVPAINLDEFDVTEIVHNYTLTKKQTVYWCTIHKRISNGTSHIVAFKPKLEDAHAKRHTHHFNMYFCRGENIDELLEPYVGTKGDDCHAEYLPRSWCRHSLYAWSMGGRILVFPDDIGFPWGTQETEYYLFEAHIDNPEHVEGETFETGVQIYHTPKIRKHAAGMLAIAYATSPALMVPPATKGWTIVGHCSSDCTQSSLPEGINIINANLHAHKSGRKMKLRHFQSGQELPWLAKDDTYDFDFQENRPLPKEIKILPGDHVSLECTFDSDWKEPPGAVIGGFETKDEMCMVFLFYYPRVTNLETCGSGYSKEKLLNRFGIEEFHTEYPNRDPVIQKPEHWANLSYSEVLNKHIVWTDDLKKEIAMELRYGEHSDFCGTVENAKFTLDYVPLEGQDLPTTKYPEIEKDYEEPTICGITTTTTDPNGSNYLHIKHNYILLGFVGLRILLS